MLRAIRHLESSEQRESTIRQPTSSPCRGLPKQRMRRESISDIEAPLFVLANEVDRTHQTGIVRTDDAQRAEIDRKSVV